MSKFRYIAVKSYTEICPNGTVGATKEAVEYSNISQADANARALSKAMIMANNATDCTAPAPTPVSPPIPPPLGTVTLDAVAVSPTEIDLSWTAATGTGITYSVYRGATLLASNLTALTYPVTGLTQNTTYYGFYVVAVNAYGSLNSNTAWATTPYAAPTAPVLTATDISSAEIDLTWPAVTGLDVTYSVYGYTSPDFSPSPSTLLASGITDLFYHNTTGLSPLTEYYYRVVAINPAGSATSNEANATTLGVAPTGSIALTATKIPGPSITLNWTAATGTGITYNVYRGLTTGFPPSSGNLITSGVSGLTYTNTGLSTSTAYFYRVFAVNTWGGLESNEANATTLSALSTLIPLMTSNTSPSGVASASTVANGDDLTWGAWRAFAENPGVGWSAPGYSDAPPPQWIQYRFDSPTLVTGVLVTSTHTSITWVLSGSSDGVTFYPIYTLVQADTPPGSRQNFSNSTFYTYYRWTITDSSPVGYQLTLAGVQLYGYS